MEELYAELLLWYIGFYASDRYEALLDEKFLNDSENELYLALERCSSNLLNSMERFKRYWEYEAPAFDHDLFGRRLFASLKLVYDLNCFVLSDFAKRCCKLWHILPSAVIESEPFHTLIYADEPLSWGNEAQVRELYDRAFRYYTKG